MNDLQWLFEFESYASEREEHYEEIKTILNSFKKMFVNLLGLNILPVEEEEGGRLRLPGDEEIMPLALIAGNEGFVTTVSERWKDYKEQQEADEAYVDEEYVSIEEVEESLPDVVFPEDPEEFRKFLIWNSPETRRINETMVKPLEKDSEESVKSNISRIPKKSRVQVD